MVKHRLIPVLLLQNGFLVRSELFKLHQIIGTPIHEVKRFNEWNVDELIYLDISRGGSYDIRRDDHKVKNMDTLTGIMDAVSRTCFMPLTWGGGVRSVEVMAARFAHGADKITINTEAVRNPALIGEGARRYGSQAIVISIDVLRRDDGRATVFVDGGREDTGLDPVEWARRVEGEGAGEILLQSIERDGVGNGYDLALISAVASATRVPVIACSGVGCYEDYAEGIQAGASAVAAANIWHFKEMADRGGRRALLRAGINVRG